MRSFLCFLLFFLFSLLAPAQEECPGGVCPLPEFPAAIEEKVAPPPESFSPGNWQLLRKAEGLMDETAFLRFLGDTEPENRWFEMNPVLLCLLTLLAGIALNLTPCVLPMIPVNLLIIGAGKGEKTGVRRAIWYASGMAAAYGTLGILAAFAGISFGTLNSTPGFQIAAGIIFLILSLSMTGLIPFSFFSRFHVDARKWAGGPVAALFLLGVFAALMAGACVSPVVAAVLLFTAATVRTGSTWVVLLPFLLGIGMALPWPFAAMGISVLPKPGRKMLVVKFMLAALVALMGIWFCFTGFRALSASGRQMRSAGESFAALREGMRSAGRKNLPLLVEFHASWCKNCLAMEERTMKSPKVRSVLEENFVFVPFDAEDPADPAVRKLLDLWRITGFPAFVIVTEKRN